MLDNLAKAIAILVLLGIDFAPPGPHGRPLL
jgi:hypothetical protein